MKAKRSNYAGVIALLLAGAAGVYAFTAYVGRTPDAQKVPSQVRRTSENQTGEPKPADQATHQHASATVLTPKSENGNLTFENATEDVPEGTNPIVFAVNRYLQNSHITPAGAKALSVEVKEGTAYIDCTEAMDKTYGSTDESTLLKGLAKTLSQFPGIEKMQFLVSGKPINTFGGIELDPPVEIKSLDDSSTKPAP